MPRFPIKGEFSRNALTLTIGTSIAQAFPILFYPILGRIFTPAEFGLLATLTSITSILAVIATGKYESSILIAETKVEAANIIGLVLSVSFLILSLSFFILQESSKQFALWFNEPALEKWLFISPLSAFVIIIYSCYNEWCVRNKYFLALSSNKITNAAFTTLGKLFFGLVKVTGNGLVIGDLLGRATTACFCIYRALKKDKIVFTGVHYKHFAHLGKKYIEFPKFTLPDQLLMSVGVSVPVLIIGAYFNNIEVGYYAMTMNILSVPVSVVSVAVRDVFRQRANEDFLKYGKCTALYMKLLVRLSIAGVLGSVGLYFILPHLFTLVLGEQWKVAGEYSQILLPMVTLNFVSMSLSGVLIVARKMKVSMYWQIYFAGITIISLFGGFFVFKTIEMTLVCFAAARSSAYLFYIFLSYKHSKGSSRLKDSIN
tara:strand:+ start:6515 stop:7801 length:1287 start_codon:yes stop_codon:yes gene_type:complete